MNNVFSTDYIKKENESQNIRNEIKEILTFSILAKEFKPERDNLPAYIFLRNYSHISNDNYFLKKAHEDLQIQTFLSLEIIPVDEDGNCLFHCFKKALGIEINIIRQIIAQEVTHKDLENTGVKISYEQYRSIVILDKFYGNIIDMLVLSRVFKIIIFLINMKNLDMQMICNFSPSKDFNFIVLSYNSTQLHFSYICSKLYESPSFRLEKRQYEDILSTNKCISCFIKWTSYKKIDKVNHLSKCVTEPENGKITLENLNDAKKFNVNTMI